MRLGDVAVVPGEGFEAGADGVQRLLGGLLAVVEGHQRAGGVVQHALQQGDKLAFVTTSGTGTLYYAEAS